MKKTIILALFLVFMISVPGAHADTLPAGCNVGDNFSATTGHRCIVPLRDCAVGDLFSAKTGAPCTATNYLPGCYSLNGYSITTGQKCDGAIVNVSTPIINPVPSIGTNQQLSTSMENTQSDTTALVAAKITAQDIVSNYISQNYMYRDYRIARAYNTLVATIAAATASTATPQTTVDAETDALNTTISAYNTVVQNMAATTVTIKTGTNVVTAHYVDNTILAIASSTSLEGATQIAEQYCQDNGITAPIVTQ